MNEWLAKKWKTKRKFIVSVIFVVAVATYNFIADRKALNSADMGILLGALAGCLVLFGPIVYVDMKKIKIAKPNNRFIEPAQTKLRILYCISLVATAFIAFAILTLIHLSEIPVLINTEELVGSMVMMFLILFALFSPVTVYMLYAKMRYKRIVEYNSAEWKRLQK